MLDTRTDSIIYQSEIYYLDLLEELTTKKKLGKSLDSKWKKLREILSYLKALNYRDRLQDEDDITNITYILERLITLCELSYYPVASPLAFQEAPDIIGSVVTNVTNNYNTTVVEGGAIDFEQSVISTPSIVDSFPFADGNSARWDFFVQEDGGAMRAGTIIGVWSTDGSLFDISGELATPDLSSSTDGIEFELNIVGSDVQFVANITSGTWLVKGKRYLI